MWIYNNFYNLPGNSNFMEWFHSVLLKNIIPFTEYEITSRPDRYDNVYTDDGIAKSEYIANNHTEMQVE